MKFENVLRQLISYEVSKESNVTIIDLNGVPFEVLSITVSLLSRMLFDFVYFHKKMHPRLKNETPLFVVYEEAHKYVPKSSLGRYSASRLAIERIAKEGRKYGITAAIVSQRPSEVSETIFSQCNNFVAMRLTNPEDQNYVKRLLPDTLGSLTDSLPALQAGEALLIGDSLVMPSLVKVDLCDPAPSSDDIKYLQEWKEEWRNVDFKTILDKWQK
jgi:DNA helicase HerA-like ATPase